MKEIRAVSYVLELTEEIPDESSMYPEGLFLRIQGNWPAAIDSESLSDLIVSIWSWRCAGDVVDIQEVIKAGQAAKVLLDSLRNFKRNHEGI